MGTKLKLDFTGVESFVKCDEGQHVAILRELEEKTTQNGDDMLLAKFEVVKGASTGARVFDNFVLTEKALWKFKGFLDVAGIKADGKVIIDLDKLTGKTCIISVVHEEYNGTLRAKIDAYKKLEKAKEVEPEEDDEEEEEEAPKAKKPAPKPATAKKPAPAKKPIEEDEDDDWDEA